MPKLLHLVEFETILENYHPAQVSKSILDKTDLILLVGPTASGRNTAIASLVKSDEFAFVVSDTTREPRKNDGILEQNGREYWFKSEKEFLDGLRSGKYLEAAVIHRQQVSGISLRELERINSEHKIAVADAEVQGVKIILKAKPDTICIFLLPPSFDEWMERLSRRGDMDNQERKNRLTGARKELQIALNSDHYIYLISEKVEETVSQIQEFIKSKVVDLNSQKSARLLAQKLLEEVTTKLNN